jgi:hypothetical protein
MLAVSGVKPARAQGWLDPAWAHRRSVVVTNSTEAPLTDYQVRINLDSSFDFSHALPLGEDVRVTVDGTTLIPHWIERWQPDDSVAVIWAKVPSLPLGSSAIEVYYGNPAAATTEDGAGTFRFYDSFESKNALARLVTPTYDGSGQAMHPDIVHVPAGWNGYEYWMSNTPFPYDYDPVENPSLLASHDGINWEVPPGLTNPLAGPISGGYNNDSDLLLVGDTLTCYYNETKNSGTTAFRRMQSLDGVNWTAPLTTLVLTNFEMSPGVIYDEGLYKVWYMASAGGCYSPTQTMYMRTSTNGVVWSAATAVTFNDPSITPWHPDIQRIDGKYCMLAASYQTGLTCANNDLYWAESDDGLNWTFAPRPVMRRTGGGWDDLSLYRPTFLVEHGILRIWYSATSALHVWGTGYAEGTLQSFMDSLATPWDSLRGPMFQVSGPVRHGQKALQQDGHPNLYPQLLRFRPGRYAVSVWLYDELNTVPEHGADLRLWDEGTTTYPQHCIGVGLMTDHSEDFYTFFDEGWNYSVTSIPRVNGWHRLTIATADTICRMFLDDSLVGSLTSLDENGISRFSIEGDVLGTAWFDDVYVRSYVEPEPLTAVGPEQDTIGTLAVAPSTHGWSLSLARPSPFGGSTTLVLTLARAGHIEAVVHGVDGRRVRMLASGMRNAGAHALVWDGRDDAGRAVAPGVYYASVRTDGGRFGRKVVLAR